jgi:hypothetical protein
MGGFNVTIGSRKKGRKHILDRDYVTDTGWQDIMEWK